MPFVEVDTSHTTKPWVLHCHFATPEQGGRKTVEILRCGTEEEAHRIARQRGTMDDCYLIELFVDAGCLHAVG